MIFILILEINSNLKKEIIKKGYNFAGWYLKNNTQYNFSNAITSNVVLYAKWVPNLNVKNNL